MSYVNPSERDALIKGLRGLADYLESNPEVPAPRYPMVYAFPPDGDWPQMCAAIDATAALLGTTAHLTSGGHYAAARSFGPVEYRAVAIPPKNSDQESE